MLQSPPARAGSGANENAGSHENRFELVFASGMIGCPQWRRFACMSDTSLPGVRLLESLDQPEVGFLLIHASIAEPAFFERLSADDRSVLAALGVGTEPDVDVFCTVTERPGGEVTANVVGPIVIDPRRGTATQIVLVGSPWTPQHPIAAR